MKKVLSLTLALALFLALCAPAAAAGAQKVILSTQNLTVDGDPYKCEMYNIDGSNYFKLRDIAALLERTKARFSVSAVNDTKTVIVTRGEEYQRAGYELRTGEDNSATCVPSEWKLVVDGVLVEASTYNIGGSNFYKLRDMGDALGFAVDYNSDTQTAMVFSDAEHTAVAGSETPFFSGFTFSAPAAVRPSATWYLSDGSNPTGESLEYSAPTITRKTNNDGTVTYFIEYEMTGRIEENKPTDQYKTGLSYKSYSLYDYYSGAKLKTRRVYNTDSFVTEGIISIQGKTYPISYLFRVDDMGSMFDKSLTTLILRYHCKCGYEVTVSPDYDGLVLATCCNDTKIVFEDYPSTDPETQDRKFDEMKTWNDYDHLDDWVFIRVKDYVT